MYCNLLHKIISMYLIAEYVYIIFLVSESGYKISWVVYGNTYVQTTILFLLQK